MKTPKKPTPKTDITPYKGHPALYGFGAVGALLFFIVTAAIAMQGTPGWEHTLARMINYWPESLNGLFQILTLPGEVFFAPVVVALAFLLRYYRLAWRLALSLLGTYTVVFVIKHLIGRERPAQLFTDIHARVQETGLGFPSNHTASITVIMLTLLPYLPWKWRWLIPIPIIAVALSRVYLGVHLPLDVVGAMALGVIVVAVVRLLPQSLRVFLRID